MDDEIAYIEDTDSHGPFVRAVFWKATGNMRWATLKAKKKPLITLLLQQEWMDKFSGAKEWRTVPDVGIIEEE